MTRKVVLVSGAGGFVGRWSIPPLLAAGYEVHAVLSHLRGRELPPQLHGAMLHGVDLLDPAAAAALLRDLRPTHWLHFAWIATPGVYSTSPDNYRWLEASRALLDSFQYHGGVRAVAAGSCAEYDWSRVGVCSETTSPLADTALAPPLPYAACKLAMQRSLASAVTAGGLSAAWGRIFFQFGPDEYPQRLVASVIVNLLSGCEAPCSHGAQLRSFLHVADVGAAFAALLDSATQGAVNIGSPEQISIAVLLRRIAEHIGRPELIRLGARSTPPGEPPLLVPDVRRLYDEVQWRPTYALNEAIVDTVAWWRARLTQRPSTNAAC